MNKTVFSLLILAFLAFSVGNAYSQQLSKEEEKKWKDIAKDYKKNPAALKKLSDENQSLKREVQSLQNELTSIKSQISTKDSRIADLEGQLFQLQAQLSAAQNSLDEMSSSGYSSQGEALPDGVVFRVQIGAYKDKQISESLDTTEDFDLEQGNNMQKIVLGQFRDYNEAVMLRDHLVSLGLSDAWIVSYRNGMRVPIDEVLGGGFESDY